MTLQERLTEITKLLVCVDDLLFDDELFDNFLARTDGFVSDCARKWNVEEIDSFKDVFGVAKVLKAVREVIGDETD